jgi:hypothetical protein
MKSAEDRLRAEDHLRRFDLVFRTLLVIASILISGSFAFYRGLLDSRAFPLIVLLFAISICTWAFGTLLGQAKGEGMYKLLAWWSLIFAFMITLARLLFYSTPSIPKFVLTTGVIVSLFLSYPMFSYLRDLTPSSDRKILKAILIIASAVLVVADLVLS